MRRNFPRRGAACLAALGLVPLALVGAIAPASAVTPSPSWGTPADLGDTYWDPVPFLSADGSHAVAMLSSGNDLGVAYSANGGAWTGPGPIGSTHEPTYWSAATSSDAQTVAAAYMDYNDTYGTYVLVSNDGGDTWRSEVTLSTQSGCDTDDVAPLVAVSPGGDVIAVAYNYDDCTYDSVIRVSTDGGATWGAEELLPKQAYVDYGQIRAQDDGRVLASWGDNSLGDFFMATRSAAGVWSSASSIDDPSSTRQLGVPWLDVSADGTQVVATWTEDVTVLYVRTGTWSGNSVTWSSAVEIVAGTTGLTGRYDLDLATGPQISMDGDTIAFVIWSRATNRSPFNGYAVVSSDGGQTFTLSPELTPYGGDSYMLSLSDSGDVVHVSWGDASTQSGSITSADAGQTWSAIASVSTSEGRQVMSAASSSGGKLLGVWVGGSPVHSRAALATVAVPAPPGAPATAKAVMNGGTVTVTWTAPSSAGAGTINNYYIIIVGGGSCSVSGSTFTCVFSGLNVSVTYTVIIYVESQYGWSPPTYLESEVVTGTAPSKPRTPTAAAGNASAVVSWVVPSNSGGQPVLSYLVTSTPGSKTCTATAPSTSCTVSTLINGTSYTFSVVAVNIIGTSGAATTSAVTPVAPRRPGAPGVRATTGDKALLVTVTKPSDAGTSAITEYKVVAKPGGKSCTITPSGAGPYTCEITGLVNGEDYTLEATAKNSVGVGAKGTGGPFSPGTKPGKPRNLVIASRSSGVLKLEWDAPASDGGRAIQGYVVFYRLEDATKLTTMPLATGLKRTLSDLTPGARYRVSVAAKNSIGRGETTFLANVRVPK